MDVASVRFLVAGRVQGVGFRASTRAQARALGIGGHAINLDDGRVEVIACGPPDAIDRLQTWLREGPPGARVDHLEHEAIDLRSKTDFRIG